MTSSADLFLNFDARSTGMPGRCRHRPGSRLLRVRSRTSRAWRPFVHRIVDDLGKEMMQRLSVPPIHARRRRTGSRPENLDVRGAVAVAGVLTAPRRAACASGSAAHRRARHSRPPFQAAEEVVAVIHTRSRCPLRIEIHSAIFQRRDRSCSIYVPFKDLRRMERFDNQALQNTPGYTLSDP